MDADEIIQLTPETLADLLEVHQQPGDADADQGKRQAPRWVFPGATQIWVGGATGEDQLIFGTCCNLSHGGLGVRTEDPLPVGERVPIAIHLPAATYHGTASVKHCTPRAGAYYVGMEFVYD